MLRRYSAWALFEAQGEPNEFFQAGQAHHGLVSAIVAKPYHPCSTRMLTNFVTTGVSQRVWQEKRRLTRYQESLNSWTADSYFDAASVLHRLDRIDEAIGYILRGLAINHWFAEALARKCKAASGHYFGADSREWADNYSADNRKYWPPQALKSSQPCIRPGTSSGLASRILRAAWELESQYGHPEKLPGGPDPAG